MTMNIAANNGVVKNTDSDIESEINGKVNFLDDFNRAMSLSEYMSILDDQRSLYDLHYKKADTGNWPEPPDNLKLLIITEPWCGDSTAIVPVLYKLFKKYETKIRILRRDANPELIDQFLTNGGRAIPIIILLDKDGNYQGRFGPRPAESRQIFENHRQAIKNGEIQKSEVIRKIRTFYSKDRGKAILKDFFSVLNRIYPE